MNTLKTTFCSLLLLMAPGIAAQDTEYPPDLSVPEDAVSARLEPSAHVVPVGGKLKVTLVAQFKRDVLISKTVLGGYYLLTYLDDKQSRTIDHAVDGVMTIAGDALVQRTVEIDLAEVFKDEQVADNARLTLNWSGLPGAVATVQLVPDQSGIDIEALDLAKTKVKLITSMGDMVVVLRPDKAPNHARNFVKLAKEGFYDGTQLHRVIKNFMVQGGDPYTKQGAAGRAGTGGPGYTVDAEFSDLKHVRGTLSMARSTDPNSAGSQFFIMHGDAPSLDGQYSIFGMVDTGLETLDKIVDVPVTRTPTGEVSVPVEPVYLYAAVVIPVNN